MVNISRGDIYWVDFGQIISSAPAKVRPFLILQVNQISNTGIKTVIGCAITSNLSAANFKGAVFLALEDSGLPKDSVARLTELATFDKRQLDEYVGQISDETMRLIDDALRDVLGL
jgi:mRNA interferase MazF